VKPITKEMAAHYTNEKSNDVNKDDKKTENRTKHEEEGHKSITERGLLIT